MARPGPAARRLWPALLGAQDPGADGLTCGWAGDEDALDRTPLIGAAAHLLTVADAPG